MKTGCKIICCVLLVLVLAACASSSPDVVARHEAQRLAMVQDGVLLSVRAVKIDGSQSGIGGAAGGAAAAIAGTTLGGSRAESQIIGILAGVAGAVAGNFIERTATSEAAQELLIEFKDGQRRTVVQTPGEQNLRPGDAINIITSAAGKVRVVKAPW